MAADRFTFGEDYAEWFDGLDWREAKLVWKGALQAGNERKFIFRDESVEVGRTYAYWMGAVSGPPTGPVGIRVRDPEVWWTATSSIYASALCVALILGAVTGVPRRLDLHGQAHPGLRAGKGEKCIALIGAVHAARPGRS